MGDPIWVAAATRGASAYRALRAAGFLLAHEPSSLPRFAATARLAATDLLVASSDAARAAASAPPSPALPAALPRAPLSSGHARVPLSALPARDAPAGRDGTLEQAAKDARRDEYVVNGERLRGAEVGFSGVVEAALRCARRGGAPAAAAGEGALRGALSEALRRAGRTCSAGDSFEAAQRALGLGADGGGVFLSADSAGAAPISVTVGGAGAAAAGEAPPRGALEGALRALRACKWEGDGGEGGEGALADALAWASGLRTGLRLSLRAPSAYYLVRAGAAAEPVRVARVAAEWAASFLVCEGGELLAAEPGFVDVVVEVL